MEVAMDVLTNDKVARIREINDNFRNSFRGGQALLTASIAELPDMVKASALESSPRLKTSMKKMTRPRSTTMAHSTIATGKCGSR
jgi:hypothetical protein